MSHHPRISKLFAAFALTVFGLLASAADHGSRSPSSRRAMCPASAFELGGACGAVRGARRNAGRSATVPDDIAIGTENGDEYTDTDPSALTEFRPVLEDHGQWVDDPTYGTVWVPSSAEVGSDFQPYVTAGHWTYADDTSWVWVSDYDWGWVPFHYGRWVSLPSHGWSWIPGRRYAGAWVTWRTGPIGYGYVGWAPAPPAWYWYGGVAMGWSFGFYSHHHHYVYCPNDYVYHDRVGTYVARGPAARVHDARTVDYVPAQPAVNAPSRQLANPTVDGAGGSGGDASSPIHALALAVRVRATWASRAIWSCRRRSRIPASNARRRSDPCALRFRRARPRHG